MTDRLDSPKVTTLIAWMTAVVTVAILVIAVMYWPQVLGRTNEIQQNSDLAACRSQANATVTDARTEFDVARATRDTAATHLTVLTNEGLVAAVTNDDATFARVLGELPAARQAVTDAEQVVVDRTANLRDVTARYHDLVVLSRQDPAAFLRHCREQG
jgi:hypothetical protein